MSVVLGYKGYHATIKYDPENKIFTGKVTDVKDSLNFHAGTATEARTMFVQSIDNYLGLCREIGKEPEE